MTSLKEWDYEEIKVIGRGQYGKAHLVRHGKDGTSYIAKTIDLTCLSKKERETALQEVELLRRLDHPNIVEYKDNFFMGDTLVIMMQYCEGGDLAAYIKESARKKQRIREEQIMNYFVQILQALQYIHTERILHRDLKTSNLFLTKKASVVKLGDFGISRVLEGSIEAAITVVGTPYYMSPEVCENKPYTFKSDVWSLGCVLYELCMLKHAFSADNLLGLVYKIVSDKYEPIPKMYPQDLNNLIQRMLTKMADLRPSVRDLLADSYVQRFMNEYVRTRGQCATPATASNRTGAGRGGGYSAGAGGNRSAAAGGADSGSGGTAGAGAAGVGRGGAQRGAGRPRQHGSRVARPARPSGGHPNSSASKVETPKERMERRKREAADQKAEELKVAAAEAATKKEVARKMKEAEFQSTRPGGGMAVIASSSAPTWRPGNASEDGRPEEGWPQVADDTSTEPPTYEEDEDLEPLEEIYSEAESSAEEYEDDFEDDLCTEDELTDINEELEPEFHHMQVGHLSTVREEQDFTRVMSNYEQDLARSRAGGGGPVGVSVAERAGASPPPRRSLGLTATVSAPEAAPTSTVGLRGSGGSAGGGPPAGSAIMDMRSRASRLREELMRKMGAETFQKAFEFLVEARKASVDERTVRRELEALVGRDTYKLYCFDVDQLVFQQMIYS